MTVSDTHFSRPPAAASTLFSATNFPRQPAIIVYGVGAACMLVSLWALVTDVSILIDANGRVVASGHPQIVQHLEGGVLERLAVREGQSVSKGQLLAKVADIGATSALGSRFARMTALRARISRLRAEAASSEMRPLEGLAADDPAYQSERAAYLSRVTLLEQQVGIQRQQREQRRAELADLVGRRRSLMAEARLADDQNAILTSLQSRNSASRLEVLNAESRGQQIRTNIAEVEGAIPTAEAAIDEASARIAETETGFRVQARTDLAAADAELMQLTQESRADQDRVDRSELRAPVSGVVNRLYIATNGGVMRPGDPVMEITPTDGPLVVEARVSPRDRADLRPGLPCKVKLTAYDYAVYGSAPGRVTDISADTLPDDQGQRFYRVRIVIDRAQGLFGNQPVFPGMTAEAGIVVGERSILSFLLSPLTRFAHSAFRETR